jgi:hypothetical protein
MQKRLLALVLVTMLTAFLAAQHDSTAGAPDGSGTAIAWTEVLDTPGAEALGP